MFSLEAMFGRKDKTLALLQASADAACDAAHAATQLVGDGDADRFMATLMDARQRSKALARQISTALIETFVTSLEREDIEAMNAALYVIPKTTERFAERYRLVVTRLGDLDFGARTDILARSAEVVAAMVRELRSGLRVAPMRTLQTQLQALEAEGDRLLLAPYRDFYLSARDPMRALLAKDLFETVEQAINQCRDAGNIIYTTVLKNS